MSSKQTGTEPKALVTVFEDLETAKSVVEKLHEAGFSLDKIELVTHRVHTEAPEVETPIVHETTESSMIQGATKWGGLGVGTGLLAGILTGFPGLALGMAMMGGVTGAIMGGMAGVDHAVNDDSVDLPTLDEYEQMVKNGRSLVVVQGNHEEVMRAEEVVKDFPDIHQHVHAMHGHEFHEHAVHSNDAQ